MGAAINRENSSPRMEADEFVRELERHWIEFTSVARGKLWHYVDLEDVIADARMAAWERLGSFTAGTNFRAWFYRILLNKCYVANRRRMRVTSCDCIEQDAVFHGGWPSTDRDPLNSVSDDVQAALARLPVSEKDCLCLRAFDGCSYREIADRLGLPIGTVMTRLYRARIKLRNQLRYRRRHRPRADSDRSGTRKNDEVDTTNRKE